MSGVSFGIPINSGRPSSTDKNRFEMLGPGPKDVINMPISMNGVTRGSGANGVSGGVYPAALDDGFFFTKVTITGDDFGVDNVGGVAAAVPYRPARSNDYFNYAPDATKPLYLYFGANNAVIVGDENNPFSDNPTNSVVNDDYEPGAFHSEAITGFKGQIDAWFGLKHVQEATFGSYVEGSELTVQKGRLKLAASGEKIIGVVTNLYGTERIRVTLSLTGVYPTKA